jgi:uncharacterized membrane protein YeiH
MFEVLEFVAVVTAAVYGSSLAIRKGMDLVGVACVSLACSFGGGTLRDLFLGRHPLFWMANDHYVAVVLAIALLAARAPQPLKRLQPILPVSDAIGLGLFAVLGAQAARECGGSYLVAAIFGVITGNFGGVIGDVLCNEIPAIFRPAPLYATCAFTGAWVYLLAGHFGLPSVVAAPLGVLAGAGMRLWALRFNITLSAVR